MIKTDEFRTARNGLGITLFIPDDVEDATEADFTMQAGPGELSADPRPHLQRAITALQDELADIDRCPVHRHRSSTRPTPDGEIGELVEAERLMREFYLSASYDPKAARPADNVKAAIAFALETQAADIARLREALADLAEAARNSCDANKHPPLTEALAEADALLATRTDVR